MGGALGLGLLGWPAVAAAGDVEALPRARLRYEILRPLDAACPDESVFRKRVALRLGYDPFVADDVASADLVRVRVVAKGRGMARAELELSDAAGRVLGKKTIDGPSSECDDLVANAAFAASLAIDPAASGRALPEPPPPPPPPPSPTAPAPVVAVAPEIPPAVRRDASVPVVPSLRAGVGVSSGVAPSPAVVVALALEARRAALSVSAEGRADLPAEDVRSGVIVRSSLLAGGASFCGHLGSHAVSAAACVAVSVGALRGETRGISAPARDATVYVVAGPRLGLRVALVGALGVDLRVDVPFVLTDTELAVGNTVLWTTPSVGVVGTLGPSVTFH